MYSWHCQYYFHFTCTRKEVHAGLHHLIQDLQVDHFACFLIRLSHDRSPILRPPEAFTSYPRAWIESYIRSASYLPDPIIHEARWTNEPFYWGPGLFLKPYSPGQRQIIKDAGEYGIRYGLAIPVHGPTGSFGVFIVAHRNLVWLKKRTEGEYARLYAVAFDLHEYMLDRAVAKARRVEDAWDLRKPELLRKHEREVLYWTGEGYPAKVIGAYSGSDEEHGEPVPECCEGEAGMSDEVRGGGACVPVRAVAWESGQLQEESPAGGVPGGGLR